ncbi:hypothetical protein CAPTEDRAFT_192237 [Capitella teleta]|uniref:Uncharacterized protein n=1 Tax=Capitella teleta TaxID=283909 RepID=R7UL34_CAPTE|nr:hypothetical protein CAPTEDRAFT_192237 [Capitella teleta]|eukprot:ELU04498.1 hypothetical protein CAPTEDRAFT_192237 [Capitella teleta]
MVHTVTRMKTRNCEVRVEVDNHTQRILRGPVKLGKQHERHVRDVDQTISGLKPFTVGQSFMHQLFSADEASKLSTCAKSLRIRFEKDSKQWEETELTNAIYKDASSGCNSYKYQSEYVYGNSTNIFGHPTKPKYQSKDVTLMVHLTSDRIEKLIRLTENWSGPISAAIYVDNITDSLMIENMCHFQSRPNIYIHILHKVGILDVAGDFKDQQAFHEYPLDY